MHSMFDETSTSFECSFWMEVASVVVTAVTELMCFEVG